jgi:hypothetical protein
MAEKPQLEHIRKWIQTAQERGFVELSKTGTLPLGSIRVLGCADWLNYLPDMRTVPRCQLIHTLTKVIQ